jgi:hypothetical protein
MAQSIRWNIYRAANKAKLIGSVEAGDADAAIEKAAKAFKADAWRDRLAVLMVSGQCADAGAHRVAFCAAGREMEQTMPIEFLHGRPLSSEELEMIRQQIEEGFDNIAEVDDEIRGIVARNWPHLLSKLPPEED